MFNEWNYEVVVVPSNLEAVRMIGRVGSLKEKTKVLVLLDQEYGHGVDTETAVPATVVINTTCKSRSDFNQMAGRGNRT